MPISMNNTTLTFNNGTTMTTAATGTVSSVATGNGLQGGTITTTGTLSVACPGFNTVGSYATGATVLEYPSPQSVNSGSNYSAGGGNGQIGSGSININPTAGDQTNTVRLNNLSGTWKWMGATTTYFNAPSGGNGVVRLGLVCRVS